MIIFASSIPITRAPNARILVLLCCLESFAEYGSEQTTARTPFTLLLPKRFQLLYHRSGYQDLHLLPQQLVRLSRRTLDNYSSHMCLYQSSQLHILSFQVLYYLILHVYCSMIITNSDFHDVIASSFHCRLFFDVFLYYNR